MRAPMLSHIQHVFSIVFEPGCERSVASADAVNLSALETAIFRDLPALLSTVRWHNHLPCCLSFYCNHSSFMLCFSLAADAGKRAARCGFQFQVSIMFFVYRLLEEANVFHFSRPSHWNCTSVEEALILLLRLNDMLQVCSRVSAHPA
jgi:hypothetical protein